MHLKYFVTIPLVMLFSLALFFPNPSFADYVYNVDVGKFVRADTEIFDSAAEQFKHAEKLEENGNLDDAENAYSYVFRKFPDSPLAQDAIIKIGEVQEKQEKYKKAFQNYQKIIDLYPQSRLTDEVLARQYKIGNLFLSGKKAKLLNLSIVPGLPQAVKIFQKINENGPFSDYGRKAQFQLALTYKKKGDLKDSIAAFQKYIDNYPNTELASEAYFQLAEIAYKRSMRRNNDRRLFKEATQHLQDFLHRYPDTADTERISEMLANLADRDAESIYNIAMYYEDASYLDSAIMYYKQVVKEYPGSEWAENATERLKTFEDPEKFLLEGKKMLNSRLQQLEAEKHSIEVSDDDSPVTEDIGRLLEEKIETVKEDLKRLEKEKRNEIRIRWESLRRKKWELSDKKKRLKKKEKALREHPSADLDAAIARWRESLVAEDYALKMEERELRALEKNLGIKRFFSLGNIFKRSTLGFGDIAHFKAKDIDKIEVEVKELENTKQALYDELNMFDDSLSQLQTEHDKLYKKVDTDLLKKEEQELAREQKKLGEIEKKLAENKNNLKKTQSLASSLSSIPGTLIKPFKRTPRAKKRAEINSVKSDIRDSKDEIALARTRLERLEEVHGKLNAKKAEVVAPAASEEDESKDDWSIPQERIDKRNARKQVMGLEKKINSAHQMIDDGLKRRKKLLKQLDKTVDEIDRKETPFILRLTKGLASPFVSVYDGSKAFLFGLEDIETQIEKKTDAADKKTASSLSRPKYRAVKDAIKQVDSEIQRAELALIEHELALEKLIADLEGKIKVRKSKTFSVQGSDIEKKIAEQRAYIEAAEAEMTETQNKLVALEEEFANEYGIDSQDEMIIEADVESTEDDQELLLKAVDDLEEALDVQKRIVREKEEAFQEKQHSLLRKTSKKTIAAHNAKFQKKIENIKKKKADVIDSALSVLSEQEEYLAKYEDIIHNKITRIKKHIEVMDQYQDTALDDMKETQKAAYKELDEVTSYMKRLDDERAALTKK